MDSTTRRRKDASRAVAGGIKHDDNNNSSSSGTSSSDNSDSEDNNNKLPAIVESKQRRRSRKEVNLSPDMSTSDTESDGSVFRDGARRYEIDFHHRGNLNAFDILRENAQQFPARVALRWFDDELKETKVMTYGELIGEVLSVARYLEHGLGLGGRAQHRRITTGSGNPNSNSGRDHVLLVYDFGLEFCIAFWACLSLDIVAVPLCPPDPSKGMTDDPALKIQNVYHDCGARAVLTSCYFRDVLRALKPLQKQNQSKEGGVATAALAEQQRLSERHAVAGRPDVLGLEVPWHCTNGPDVYNMTTPEHYMFPESALSHDGKGVAFLQYTSGSTGDAKGVMVSHANLIYNAAVISEMFLTIGDGQRLYTMFLQLRIVSWLPFFHDMGLIGFHVTPLLAGTQVAYMSPLTYMRDPKAWLRLCSKPEFAHVVTGCPPSALERCATLVTDAEIESGEIDLSRVDALLIGAEPIRQRALNLFREKMAAARFNSRNFMPCYGLAEGSLYCVGKRNTLTEPTYFFADAHALHERGMLVECRSAESKRGRSSFTFNKEAEGKRRSKKRDNNDTDYADDADNGTGARLAASPTATETTTTATTPRGTSSKKTGGSGGVIALVSSGEQLSDEVVPNAMRALIVDPKTGDELPDGHIGEIWLKGVCKTLGYFAKPEKTRETFDAHIRNSPSLGLTEQVVGGPEESAATKEARRGWLRTGDLAAKVSGQLYVTGRLKELLIFSGRNIYPSDVEDTVRTLNAPLIRQGAVIALVTGSTGDILNDGSAAATASSSSAAAGASSSSSSSSNERLVVIVEIQSKELQKKEAHTKIDGTVHSRRRGGGSSHDASSAATTTTTGANKGGTPWYMRRFVLQALAAMSRIPVVGSCTGRMLNRLIAARTHRERLSMPLSLETQAVLRRLAGDIRKAITLRFSVNVDVIVLQPRTLTKTSSGKPRRLQCAQWLATGTLHKDVVFMSDSAVMARAGTTMLSDASSSSVGSNSSGLSGARRLVSAATTTTSAVDESSRNKEEEGDVKKMHNAFRFRNTRYGNDDTVENGHDELTTGDTVASSIAHDTSSARESKNKESTLSSSILLATDEAKDHTNDDNDDVLSISSASTDADMDETPSLSSSPVMPADMIRATLLELVALASPETDLASITEDDRIDTIDNFDSMKLQMLLRTINDRFKLNLKPHAFWFDPTIKGVIAVIHAALAKKTSQQQPDATTYASSSSSSSAPEWQVLDNPPYVLGIGTEVPPTYGGQTETIREMVAGIGLDEKLAKFVTEVVRNTEIKKRHTVLEKSTDVFWGRKGQGNDAGMDERNKVYKAKAPELATAAARKAIADWGGSKEAITHVVAASCTGIIVPGIEFHVSRALDLPLTCQRTSVHMMGCFGCLSVTRVASALAAQNPKNRVLAVCVELCSLHHQNDTRKENLVASTLFADGSGAMIFGIQPTAEERPHFEVHASMAEVIPKTLDMMRWDYSTTGFIIGLSPGIPGAIAANIAPFVERMLKPTGAKPRDCVFAIHPGGSMIIKNIQHELGIDAERHASASWHVLREYGNMSSATLVFILEQVSKERAQGKFRRGKWVPALAFGPGLNVEGAMFRSA